MALGAVVIALSSATGREHCCWQDAAEREGERYAIQDGYVRASMEGRTGPGPFNVCSGIARSVGDMLREMMALAGVSAAIRQRPGAGTPPGLDVPYQCGSRVAIGKVLGWEPQIAWRETLRDILADWRTRVQTEEE